MPDAIELEHLESVAFAVLDFADAIGTLLVAERRAFRWLLIAYEQVVDDGAVVRTRIKESPPILVDWPRRDRPASESEHAETLKVLSERITTKQAGEVSITRHGAYPITSTSAFAYEIPTWPYQADRTVIDSEQSRAWLADMELAKGESVEAAAVKARADIAAKVKYLTGMVEKLRRVIDPPKIRLTLEQYLDRVTRTDEEREALMNHLFQATARNRTSGMDADAALATTLNDFGDPTENVRPHNRRLDELGKLEQVSVLFIDVAEAMRRPLMDSERRAFSFIWLAWQSPEIKTQSLLLSDDECERYFELMGKLREVIRPNPAELLRLQRKKTTAVAQLCEGNFAVKSVPFAGVSKRRMNSSEATRCVAHIESMVIGIDISARELSLARNQDRELAKIIARAARKFSKLGREFAARTRAHLESAQHVVAVMNVETRFDEYASRDGTRQACIEHAERMTLKEAKQLAAQVGGKAVAVDALPAEPSGEEISDAMRSMAEWMTTEKTT